MPSKALRQWTIPRRDLAAGGSALVRLAHPLLPVFVSARPGARGLVLGVEGADPAPLARLDAPARRAYLVRLGSLAGFLSFHGLGLAPEDISRLGAREGDPERPALGAPPVAAWRAVSPALAVAAAAVRLGGGDAGGARLGVAAPRGRDGPRRCVAARRRGGRRDRAPGGRRARTIRGTRLRAGEAGRRRARRVAGPPRPRASARVRHGRGRVGSRRPPWEAPLSGSPEVRRAGTSRRRSWSARRAPRWTREAPSGGSRAPSGTTRVRPPCALSRTDHGPRARPRALRSPSWRSLSNGGTGGRAARSRRTSPASASGSSPREPLASSPGRTRRSFPSA